MRYQDGTYVCTLCGRRIDAPPSAPTQLMILSTSGKPNVRVVLVDGLEVHRCIEAPVA